MNPEYLLNDPMQVFSPGLLFYKTLIQRNIRNLVTRAGAASRLRPHVKTHKTRQIVRLELAAGITKQKCATIAEAEMVAQCEVPDILIAYPLVGPNCARFVKLIEKYPHSRFSVIADHEIAIRQLSEALKERAQQADVLLDIDVGQHRTGIAPGSSARKLYEMLQKLPGLRPGGLHVYDGHNHQSALPERQAAVQAMLGPVFDLRAGLEKSGLPVPRFVCGGTPTFPIFSGLEIAGLECSPGTCVLSDAGYGQRFTDMGDFTPAALLLTRVISRPTPTRVTFDLGYKAVSPDQPAGKRCVLLNVPGAEAVVHNEEHLAVETPEAASFQPGDVVYAMPMHVCPTVALHAFAYVVEHGNIVDRWEIASRDRIVTV
jgi:D-serine deaminase-like pyridoxal phosphate-dependent protein